MSFCCVEVGKMSIQATARKIVALISKPDKLHRLHHIYYDANKSGHIIIFTRKRIKKIMILLLYSDIFILPEESD